MSRSRRSRTPGPGTETGHAGAGRRHHPGDATTAHLNFRRAKPKPHGADKVGLADHQVPHTRVHASGAHMDEHLLVTDRRPVDVRQLEHVGRTVHVLNDRLHFVTPRWSGYWNTPPSGTPNTWAIRNATWFEQDGNTDRSPTTATGPSSPPASAHPLLIIGQPSGGLLPGCRLPVTGCLDACRVAMLGADGRGPGGDGTRPWRTRAFADGPAGARRSDRDCRAGGAAGGSGGRHADLAASGPASLGMVCPWVSMTKVVTATSAMRLADRGLLGLDRPVLRLTALRAPEPRGGTTG